MRDSHTGRYFSQNRQPYFKNTFALKDIHP